MSVLKEKIEMALYNPGLYIKRFSTKIQNSLRKIPDSGKVMIDLGNGVKFEADYSMEFEQMIEDMVKHRYEIDVTYAMEQFLSKGDIFVDIGANIGYMSAKALSLVGKSGEVHSFEPVKKYFELLTKVGKLNPSHILHPNNFALGESAGENTFFINEEGNFGANSFVKEYDNTRELTIPIETFDNYLQKNNISSRISMFKIDCEGYELYVLRGMKQFLENGNRPIFVMEISPKSYSLLGYAAIDIIKFLNNFGYYPYDLRTRKKLGKKFIKELTRQINMIFIPE